MNRRITGVRTGAICWIAAAGIHMAGRLRSTGPGTEQELAYQELASTVTRDTGFGAVRTALEMNDALSLGFALILFLLGFLTLLLSGSGRLPDAALRRVAGMSSVAAAALLIVAVRGLGPLQALVFGLATAAFSIAWPGAADSPNPSKGTGLA